MVYREPGLLAEAVTTLDVRYGGRDCHDIVKMVMGPLDPGPGGEKADQLICSMRHLASLGITHYHGSVPGVSTVRPLALLGERVIPAVADL